MKKYSKKKKIKLAMVFGGRSTEHEVSCMSAKNIAGALDAKKYSVSLVYIDKNGRWYFVNDFDFLKKKKTNPAEALKNVDVVFPALHGAYGEDGAMQGLLKMLNVAFVGPGILGSAVCMDKEVAKKLLRGANIPIAKFLAFRKAENKSISFSKVKKELGLPLFVKPANAGSSVGVSKARNEKEFKKAIEEAFLYDSKILIEENISGREVECAVLGNDAPTASLVGEIVPQREFYSYEAKYIDEDGALLKAPVKLPKRIEQKIQNLAVLVYKVLNCDGMARVDFFLKENGSLLVNEVNTIPGFTKNSMYPKLWEASGVSYSQLVDTLISLALERHSAEKKVKSSIA